MAITLEQAKALLTDEISQSVIDEFRKSNYLMENMVFDDAVYPAGNGGALSYSYYRLTTLPSADFRAINSNYTSQTINKTKYTVDLKAFGGSFNIDRVLAKSSIIDEVAFQSKQMIKQTIALFNDTIINGDTSEDGDSFDGLEKALDGSSTEFNGDSGDSAIDISAANIDTNYKKFLDMLDEFILSLDGTPSVLMGNTTLIAKIRACARRTGNIFETLDDFGRQIVTYGGIPLIDMGNKSGSTNPVIATTSGETNLYAVRLGLDAFHGICMRDSSPIRIWLPDFETAGAVKQGEVEMVAAVALKDTKTAGVFRQIKVE